MPNTEPDTPVIQLPATSLVGMTVKVPIPFGVHEFSITKVTRDCEILSTFFDGGKLEIKRFRNATK